MPIQSGDIKLLKSAVMADTPDGGGAMVGAVVVDGQSNNLFPDTSAMDRAFGRVNFRKVFGVAHSDDTATAMGAHAILTQPPADPLVHCALLKTSGWADTREQARSLVERYLAKGPRLSPRLYDMHYAGSMQIKLVAFVATVAFPVSGDGIVLRNPNGTEQFVRVTKTTLAREDIAVAENNGVVILTATVATCQIGQELAHDFPGPPPARVLNESQWTQVYSTTLAGGAKFYGIKPLVSAAAPGDYSATVDGGIYTPLVPAATIESPVIDKAPLTARAAVLATARAAVTLPAVTMTLGPGSVLTLPTAIEAKSVAFTHGGTAFASDSAGNITQGGVTVGMVDLSAGTVSMASNAPSYGSAALTMTYKPGTLTGATAFSAAFGITQANQGLGFTNAFEPPPAPGSFTLSYQAQGRWYDLPDNLHGKLSGADSGYGVGTLNYGTGSMSVTLGAIPDVGSSLIATWGDGASAKPLAGTLPARFGAALTLPARAKGEGITVTWSRGGSNYTATTNAAGALTGDATGAVQYGVLTFNPSVFPEGDVGLACTLGPNESNAVQASAYDSGQWPYTLIAGLPVVPGSFKGTVLSTFDPLAETPVDVMPVWDENGVIYARYLGEAHAIGTLDYNTGAVLISGSASIHMAYREVQTVATGWNAGSSYSGIYYGTKNVAIGALTGVTYAWGAGATAHTGTLTPGAWTLRLPVQGAGLAPNGLCFQLGADVYTLADGTLRRGWNVASGAPATASAGAAASDGLITLASLPSNGANAATWHNVAVNQSGGEVSAGVFRTENAPLKIGVFQLQTGSDVAQAVSGGTLGGGGFTGTVDFQRGIVQWSHAGAPIDPASLTYNAVFLQYLPLDSGLLGLETARLPLDGKVPIFRSGDLAVVHHTQPLELPNPVTRDAAQTLGRQRIASVRVLDAAGTVVPDTLYTTALDAGTLTVPSASDLTAYTQPLTVEHRIEDMVLVSQADISGKLSFTRSLTHDFPEGSYVSSALPFGDLFARAHTVFDQATWTGVWSDALIGSAPTANFNEGQFPIVVTNKGAITERWALIFTSTTGFNIVGENVGVIGTGNTATDCSPLNPATGVPFWTVPALGFGAGRSTGNVLRFNTDACGAPFWPVRTVLQGPATLASDQFTLAFRLDVDRP